MVDKKMPRFADHPSSDALLMRPGLSPPTTTSRLHECEQMQTLSNSASGAGSVALAVVGVIGMVAAVVMLLVVAGSRNNMGGNSQIKLTSLRWLCIWDLVPSRRRAERHCTRRFACGRCSRSGSRTWPLSPESLTRTMVSSATQGGAKYSRSALSRGRSPRSCKESVLSNTRIVH